MNWRTRSCPSVLLTVVLLTTCDLPARAENLADWWPQWRGPTRDGGFVGPTWPNRLDEEHLALEWRVDLGPGYPGPIVSEDHVFVAETVDQQKEVVRAFDRWTGHERWQTAWTGAMKVPFFAKRNGSWIRATPAYDGQSLFVAGMRDVLVCLDAATGKKRWEVDFVNKLESPLPAFGFVSSPLVDGDHVYVQAGAGCCKLDKSTGEILWRTLQSDGSTYQSAFSSPALAEIHQTRQLVVQTRARLAGVAPETGQVLWSHETPAFRGMNILTPTVVDNHVFTSSYGGKSVLFSIQRSGETWEAQPTWVDSAQGYMSSPVVIDDFLYMHMRNRRFTCFDLATGKRTWTSNPFGQYCSLVAQGGNILALDQRGDLLLIRAAAEGFNLVDSRKLSDRETWAHLAVSGNQLFVRELHGLSVFRWQQATGKALAASR